MTINDVPNIQHCKVEPFISSTSGNILGYEVTTHEGWYIHFNGDEDLALIYDTYALVNVNYDFSLLEVVAEADVPPIESEG